ncbi:NAD-dependent epimerase/dehydratase family protein [Veillonellaceae bacterium WCA-693-APC-5D-A]|uniref:NAD-dependent epimerase/dehydratase family protein n=1 Tax=Anaerovibrio slackiae TaxID=2652309 RepID=A0A6I2UD34_9FIRM|nr:NAD-dependent epimerase/dehydratase family protein [Anaerovibrio slackiae]MSU07564.1 NAD-dependent epimerase/dehydratase family protein [Anaerovibrio slackiae]
MGIMGNNLHNSKTYINDLDVALNHTLDVEKLCNAKFLITGATGTIGSFLTDMLIRYNRKISGSICIFVAGRDVNKIKNEYAGFNEVIPVYYDLKENIKFNFPVDYIIHAAGNAHPSAFISDSVGTIVGNIVSTYNLLQYAQKYSVKRFLYVSSGEVYGQGDLKLSSFEEDYLGYLDIQSMRSCYPSSKRATENLCCSYMEQYGVESVVVRPSHTYGPYITNSDNRAHAQFFKNVISGEDIILKSYGKQIRSYNYIGDCASALFSVLTKGNSGEAYNLANPDSVVTIADLAKVIGNAGEKSVHFLLSDEIPNKNTSPIVKQVLSTRKIESMGWKPAFSLEDGIRHTLNILKEVHNV